MSSRNWSELAAAHGLEIATSINDVLEKYGAPHRWGAPMEGAPSACDPIKAEDVNRYLSYLMGLGDTQEIIRPGYAVFDTALFLRRWYESHLGDTESITARVNKAMGVSSAVIGATKTITDQMKRMNEAHDKVRLYAPAYLGMPVPYWSGVAFVARAVGAAAAAVGVAQVQAIKSSRFQAESNKGGIINADD